jgi:hypothetical protein
MYIKSFLMGSPGCIAVGLSTGSPEAVKSKIAAAEKNH